MQKLLELESSTEPTDSMAVKTEKGGSHQLTDSEREFCAIIAKGILRSLMLGKCAETPGQSILADE